MIQKKNNEISITVFDEPNAPKYYSFKRSLFKRSITAISITTLSVLFGSLFYAGYIQYKVQETKNKIPEEILKLSKALESTKSELIKERAYSKEITKKMASSSSDKLSQASLIKIPVGAKDATNTNKIKIQNLLLTKKDNKQVLKFDIINITPESEKVAGYLFITKSSNSSVSIYPFEVDMTDVLYNQGESFTISKFKPVEVSFPILSNKKLLYKIIVFSRTGDLLATATVPKANE